MRTCSKLLLFLFASLTCLAAGGARASEGRLLRFPDISADQVAFVYANDIWVAPRSGGMAGKLTSHPGQEWFPRFSPDGKQIAFTGDYDGNREVYVMPASGGEPVRLTFNPDIMAAVPDRFGPDNIVIGWTRGGRIIFRSRRDQWDIFMGRPWTVSPKGGLPEPMPLPWSGFLSYSPDGKRLAYNPTFREFRTWKHYRGGMAQDIYIHDLANGREQRITDYEGVDDYPMWSGDSIYFVSERDGRANLFVFDLKSKKTSQLTHFTDFDIKFPSLGPGAIVFELGGVLQTFDLASGKTQKINIQVPSDRPYTRPHLVQADKFISEFSLAPDAKRALVVARGELFAVPAEKGEARNLTRTSGARERYAQWSPDGKYIAYLSDESGEYDIYIRSGDGKGLPMRITRNADCFRFQLVWSPDSTKLLFADKNLRLFMVDIDQKKTSLIDKGEYWEIRNYSWSPDSRWVAYDKFGENYFGSIFLYDTKTKKTAMVTDWLTNDSNPVFDPDGKYLYFLSDRDLNATMAGYESNFIYLRSGRPFAVTLAADLPSPFAPESDETAIGEIKKKEDDSKEKTKTKKKVTVKVDLLGIGSRAVAFPVEPGNYSSLAAVSGKVLWMSKPAPQLSGKPPFKGSLHIFDMKKRKDEQVYSPVDNYDLAANGEKLIYKSEKNYYIVDVKADQKPGKDIKPLKLSGMQLMLDPRAEWRQIFFEAWRLDRDYYFAKNMGGRDWKAIRDRFAVLLPYVAHRSDLVYLIGEMIGELGTGHSYVGGGDAPSAAPISVGLLGADLQADPASGRYRIARIFEGQNWNEERRSPLTEPGLGVNAGDYILEINGVDLKVPTHPGSLLLNRAGKQTPLLINHIPSRSGAREIVVVPIAYDSGLRYYNWIEANRRYVAKKTGGRVGYIHLPDMGSQGLNEFVRSFYPQVRKQGLVIDVRWNGGGFVSQMILERLRRVLAGMDAPRNAKPGTYPNAVHYGPKVCLLNQWSASDGDLFPHFFRRFGLGKLIGKRSWGGVVGIRGAPNLVDGGYVFTPEFAFYDTSSKWMIENHGVDPDIELENTPTEILAGKDAQLDKAIEIVMQELSKKTYELPPRPADPIKH
ncbi:MAG TPA: S41 family peptidase [Myxococcota bacterium]|nr:S41 family peptidase [Myxococcota bacterium]